MLAASARMAMTPLLVTATFHFSNIDKPTSIRRLRHFSPSPLPRCQLVISNGKRVRFSVIFWWGRWESKSSVEGNDRNRATQKSLESAFLEAEERESRWGR
jgi:hypothetical protein